MVFKILSNPNHSMTKKVLRSFYSVVCHTQGHSEKACIGLLAVGNLWGLRSRQKPQLPFQESTFSFKLKEGRFRFCIGEKSLPLTIARASHRLPREAAAAPCLELSKARLDRAWSTLG